MKKVDFNVNQEYQFTINYKVLQEAFNKCNISRAFNVAALSKGKRQDNNEFMQWFKGYWDSICNGQEIDDYDAIGRREVCKSGDWKKFSRGSSGQRPAASGAIKAVRPMMAAGGGGGAIQQQQASARVSASARSSSVTNAPGAAAAAAAANAAAMAQLNEELSALRLQVETAERERDFYFDKLRDVEVLCQAPELQDVAVLKVIEKVLYAADSAEAKHVLEEATSELGVSLESAVAADVENAREAAPVAAGVQ
jgi:RP/EB family microtubule-associated protein